MLHVDVDITVTDKGAGVIRMTGKRRDKVLVFDLLVNVADKSAAGHVAAGDFIDRTLYFLSG